MYLLFFRWSDYIQHFVYCNCVPHRQVRTCSCIFMSNHAQQIYNEKANLNSGKDTWADGWLEGFIKAVGEKQASHLLGKHYLQPGKAKATA